MVYTIIQSVIKRSLSLIKWATMIYARMTNRESESEKWRDNHEHL